MLKIPVILLNFSSSKINVKNWLICGSLKFNKILPACIVSFFMW